MNIIFDRIKQVYGLKSDADLARLLGMHPSSVSMRRQRGKPDYERIIRSCADADLNWIFRGYGVGDSPGVRYSVDQDSKERLLSLVGTFKEMVERL